MSAHATGAGEGSSTDDGVAAVLFAGEEEFASTSAARRDEQASPAPTVNVKTASVHAVALPDGKRRRSFVAEKNLAGKAQLKMLASLVGITVREQGNARAVPDDSRRAG
jgi:hypothetical protein